MVHRIHPILRGLALGLALLAPLAAAAAGQSGNAREYSAGGTSGLASRDVLEGSATGAARLVIAQADGPFEDDAGAEARRQLRSELDRIRRQSTGEAGTASFDPPLPVRKRAAQAAAEALDPPSQRAQAAGAADPKIDRLTGQLLLLNFKGSQPADPGPRAVRALLQSGLIAGVVFGRENIQSRAQLKELMKFFWAGGAQNRPLFAIQEIGGTSDALPLVKDFEQWPSEQDVATKGDPQYAYSTYRSMGANLAALGFGMNFGPALAASGDSQDPAASFGSNPLQTGVFAKTFILGHREENVIAVPMVDGSAHSVRALKTLLVSHPATPIGSVLGNGGGAAPFSAYDGLGRGSRFCFASLSAANAASGVVNGFKRGCDVLVLDAGTDGLAAVREQIALAMSQAIRDGELSLNALNAAAERLSELRAPSQSDWTAAAAQSR